MKTLIRESVWDPNPITKLIGVVVAGFTVIHPVREESFWIPVTFLSVLYLLNKEVKCAVKNFLAALIVVYLLGFRGMHEVSGAIKMMFTLVFIYKIFYLPFAMAKFFVVTSDVGAILSSMDKLRVPSSISIPIAVMFRFFPAFKEERRNIKLAMKIRGITPKNPVKYLEYVAVPLLIISSNIAEDIAKAAETRCIENPVKKERFRKVGVAPIDFLFLTVVFGAVIGGWLW